MDAEALMVPETRWRSSVRAETGKPGPGGPRVPWTYANYRMGYPVDRSEPATPQRKEPELFSCSFDVHGADRAIRLFVAAVAADESDFRSRIFARWGGIAALSGNVRRGFDQFEPAARSLVSEELADRLAMMAVRGAPFSPDGLDVVVEARSLS